MDEKFKQVLKIFSVANYLFAGISLVFLSTFAVLIYFTGLVPEEIFVVSFLYAIPLIGKIILIILKERNKSKYLDDFETWLFLLNIVIVIILLIII